ncbi:MAG: GDYXXLXY domain-containing protein [Pseudomonadota bacterium]
MKAPAILRSRALRLGLIGLVLTLVPAWLVVDHRAIAARGTPVDFVVEPVDPRNLFRGDYVILSYPFSRIDWPLEGTDQTGSLKAGDEVFVSLVRDQAAPLPTWTVRNVSASYPQMVPAEGIVLGGTIRNTVLLTRPPTSPPGAVPSPGAAPPPGAALPPEAVPRQERTQLAIDYGIESFFVPEGEGLALEKIRDSRDGERLVAHVAVDARGRSLITGVSVVQTPLAGN